MKETRHTALITGGTGGIGKAFAERLAQKKYDLWIVDLDARRLSEMKEDFVHRFGINFRETAADLTNKDTLKVLAEAIAREGNVDMLVNCAGFGQGELLAGSSIQRAYKMMDLHLTAAVCLVHAALPSMIKKQQGRIITVASMAAFIPAPGSSVYAGTKSFLTSFMESIHMEVKSYGIKVQALCPGLTRTEFHTRLEKSGKRSSLNSLIPWMEAGAVVKVSLKCLESGPVICIPGIINRMARRIIPFLPRKLFYFLIRKFMK